MITVNSRAVETWPLQIGQCGDNMCYEMGTDLTDVILFDKQKATDVLSLVCRGYLSLCLSLSPPHSVHGELPKTHP